MNRNPAANCGNCPYWQKRNGKGEKVLQCRKPNVDRPEFRRMVRAAPGVLEANQTQKGNQ